MTFTTAVLVSVLCLLVAAILGGLIIYFMMNDRLRKIKQEFTQLQKDYQALQSECARKQRELTTEVESRDQKLLTLRQDYDQSQQDFQTLKNDCEEKQKALQVDLQKHQDQIKNQDQKIADLTAQIQQKEATIKEWEIKAADIEQRLSESNDTIEVLQARVTSRSVDIPGEKAPDHKRLALEEIREKAKSFDYTTIGTASATQKDDLKIISGIGPFIEEKLNALGIYTFEQISRFTKKDVENVTEVIKFFPGRIERDHWIDQAKELAKDKAEK